MIWFDFERSTLKNKRIAYVVIKLRMWWLNYYAFVVIKLLLLRGDKLTIALVLLMDDTNITTKFVSEVNNGSNSNKTNDDIIYWSDVRKFISIVTFRVIFACISIIVTIYICSAIFICILMIIEKYKQWRYPPYPLRPSTLRRNINPAV